MRVQWESKALAKKTKSEKNIFACMLMAVWEEEGGGEKRPFKGLLYI